MNSIFPIPLVTWFHAEAHSFLHFYTLKASSITQSIDVLGVKMIVIRPDKLGNVTKNRNEEEQYQKLCKAFHLQMDGVSFQ